MNLLPQNGVWQDTAASASAANNVTLSSHQVTVDEGLFWRYGRGWRRTGTQGGCVSGMQSTSLSEPQQVAQEQQQQAPQEWSGSSATEVVPGDRSTTAEPARAIKMPKDPLGDTLVASCKNRWVEAKYIGLT
jgi:hypothetical protein